MNLGDEPRDTSTEEDEPSEQPGTGPAVLGDCGRFILIVENDFREAALIKSAFEDGNNTVNVELEARGLSLPTNIKTGIVRSRDEALEYLRGVAPYSVTEASKGNRCPDLVTLDLQILEKKGGAIPTDPTTLYGFDVLRHIRTELEKRVKRNIPVVVLSHNIGFDRRGTGQGWDQFLTFCKDSKLEPPYRLEKAGADGPNYLEAEHLLRATAKYLLDLDKKDLEILRENGIFCGPRGSASWKILRKLKLLARSFDKKYPVPDVLLTGPNAVGKTSFAKAYHLFRQPPGEINMAHLTQSKGSALKFAWRLGFDRVDFGQLDTAGSAADLQLFGATDFNSTRVIAGKGGDEPGWSMGFFIRNTAYVRKIGKVKENSLFTVQKVEVWETGKILANSAIAGITKNNVTSTCYPTAEDEVDFERSGTLFIDEVLNLDATLRGKVLQALSYEHEERYVLTTGILPRRVRVGPAIIMATRKPIENLETNEEGDITDGSMDLANRILKAKMISIPPLKERLDEIVPYLKFKLWSRSGGVKCVLKIDDFKIQKDAEHMLTHPDGLIAYDHNFIDLDPIFDQVGSTETLITVNHILPLLSRRPKGLSSKAAKTIELNSYNGCREYLEKVRGHQDEDTKAMSLTDLHRKKHYTPKERYNLVLTFLELHSFRTTESWPKTAPCLEYFATINSTFRTDVSRLRDDLNLPDAGKELRKFVKDELEQFLNGSAT